MLQILVFRGRFGRIDPGRFRKGERYGDFSNEPLGVRFVGRQQNLLPGLEYLLGQPIVNHLGGHQADSRMVVLGVIPAEEALAKSPGIFQAAEPLRKVRPVFQGFELSFRIGVVIAGMGPAVGLGHPQVRKQKRHQLGLHGSPPVGMDRQFPRMVSWMSLWAKAAVSRLATIQPVTYRLKISRIR